jgi:pantoate--beta-alanine ligase
VKRATSFADARALSHGRTGFVATMGYLHEGHLALMARARGECDSVVASIYVNPLQFGDPADLAAYPRDLERDAALAATAGVDVLFVPDDLYPDPPSVRLTVDGLTDTMEGAHRRGHFDGVAMVVAKLLAGLRPDVAYFGRKDAQQLAVVRRLVRDLSFPTDIVGVPIVREHDGLALSSRNVRLAGGDRASALSLFAGLRRAATLFDGGERDSAALEEAAAEPIAAAADLDYSMVADAADLVRPARVDGDAFLAVAATVGGVRLIDNCHFVGGTSELGTCLDRPSTLYQGDA